MCFFGSGHPALGARGSLPTRDVPQTHGPPAFCAYQENNFHCKNLLAFSKKWDHATSLWNLILRSLRQSLIHWKNAML